MPGRRAVTGQPRWKSDGAAGRGRVAVAYAKRLQSGRLDAYLLYMLIALVAVIAVVTALARREASKASGAPRVFTYDANVPVLR
jgi:hypothetical protein